MKLKIYDWQNVYLYIYTWRKLDFLLPVYLLKYALFRYKSV